MQGQGPAHGPRHQRLSREGHRIALRVPVIAGFNDDEENVRAIGVFAAGLPSLERVDLLPYHRIGRDKYRRLAKPCPMPKTDPPSEERMAEIMRILEVSGANVSGVIDGVIHC